MWAPKSWLQSNCYPVLPSQHETQMFFGIKNTLGSKLTHQSTFLYNIKSTIRTLVAWLSMATSRPCIQLSKYVYQYIFQIQGLTKCITNNKIHDRSRIYMAHEFSFGFATRASEIKTKHHNRQRLVLGPDTIKCIHLT